MVATMISIAINITDLRGDCIIFQPFPSSTQKSLHQGSWSQKQSLNLRYFSQPQRVCFGKDSRHGTKESSGVPCRSVLSVPGRWQVTQGGQAAARLVGTTSCCHHNLLGQACTAVWRDTENPACRSGNGWSREGLWEEEAKPVRSFPSLHRPWLTAGHSQHKVALFSSSLNQLNMARRSRRNNLLF